MGRTVPRARCGHTYPDVAKNRNGIGNVLREMGQYQERLIGYQKVLEVIVAVTVTSTKNQ